VTKTTSNGNYLKHLLTKHHFSCFSSYVLNYLLSAF